MSGPSARDIIRFSLPGDDREIMLAILNQSRLQNASRIDDIQVEHLLAIGYRAGIESVRYRPARIYVNDRPTEMFVPLYGAAFSFNMYVSWWARLRSLFRRRFSVRCVVEEGASDRP